MTTQKTLSEEMEILARKITELLGNSSIEVFEYYAPDKDDDKTRIYWRDADGFEHSWDFGWNKEYHKND